MTSKGAGLLAILIAAAMMWAIPTASSGKSVDLRKTGDALRQVTDGLVGAVDQTLTKTQDELRKARERAKAAAAKAKLQKAAPRATA
ncbi:MAG: hypothetical protein QOE31_3958, partial [Solirubrobacteraceae bacterium]|nr:hypothetical protein [Solirubrobacteraceae bacterium]